MRELLRQRDGGDGERCSAMFAGRPVGGCLTAARERLPDTAAADFPHGMTVELPNDCSGAQLFRGRCHVPTQRRWLPTMGTSQLGYEQIARASGDHYRPFRSQRSLR
jgi:hypothetical protein